MSEEPKGPPKIDLEEILSATGESSDAVEVEGLEVVGMEPAASARGSARQSAVQAKVDLEDMEARHLRMRADFDNYRKRVERDQTELSRQAAAGIIRDLLPFLDNLERALQESEESQAQAFRDGVALIYRQVMQVLQAAGLEPVECLGLPFDPESHQAVERHTSSDYPDQTVMDELQKGYWFQGKLLRPALVRVAFQPETPTEDDPEKPHGET
jgi:molecular chaperone GrpE